MAFAAGLLVACAHERTPEPDVKPVGDATVSSVLGVQRVGQYGRPGDEPYPLDSMQRVLAARQLSCPKIELSDFAGVQLRFEPPASVIEPFRRRLLAFEQVVAEVSRRVYGRLPSKVLLAASYGCRSVSGANRRLSEHGLGNAIDVRGFEFAPLYAVLRDRSAAALTLAGAFEVTVARDWKARGDPVSETHAHFLAELTAELVRRQAFRTLLGPAHPDHEDHFHFDMAPSKYVDL